MLFEFDLEHALEAHPLPDEYPDVVMNKEQLFVAMGVSKPTIDNWVTKGMPVLDAGTNGKSYQFQLSHCWSWRAASKRHDEKTKSKADAVAQQMALQFLNLDETEESMGGMTADQLEEYTRRESYYNALEEGRINRVLRKDVVEVMGLVFTIVREHLQTQPDVLEREIGLEPHQTTAVVRSNDALIVQLKSHLEQSSIFADISAKLPNEEGDPAQVH